MKTSLSALLALAAMLQGAPAEPSPAPAATEKPATPVADCPICEIGSSRLAAMTGQNACPADCTKLCCTGETAYFKVSAMADAEAGAKVSAALAALDGTEVQKICLTTPCVVVTYDPKKLGPTKLIKAINDTGAKVTSQKLILKVDGMTCTGCSGNLTKALAASAGVTQVVSVSHETGTAELFVDPTETDPAKIAAVIKATGYQVTDQ